MSRVECFHSTSMSGRGLGPILRAPCFQIIAFPSPRDAFIEYDTDVLQILSVSFPLLETVAFFDCDNYRRSYEIRCRTPEYPHFDPVASRSDNSPRRGPECCLDLRVEKTCE